MSENDPQIDAVEGFSGQELVRAREAAGITAETIQRELRLTSAVVKAIEAGDIQAIGQPVFARGYIRAYCKRVELDADPFIAQYDAAVGQVGPKRQSRPRNLGTVGDRAVKVSPGKPKSGLLMRLVKLILLVAVLAGGYLAVKESGIDLNALNLGNLTGETAEEPKDPNSLAIPGVMPETSPVPVAEEAMAEPEAVGQEPAVESILAPANSEQPASGAETTEAAVEQIQPVIQTEVAASLDTLVTEAVEESVNDVQQAVSESESEVIQDSAPVAPQTSESQPANDTGAKLQITFSDVSWINIKDGKGNPLFNGLAEKGRTLELSGELPISVVIGRADAVQNLSFNGSVVDLALHTRKNVARLSLPL